GPARPQMQPRCGPDADQMQPRCGPDADQMQPRCGPDAATATARLSAGMGLARCALPGGRSGPTFPHASATPGTRGWGAAPPWVNSGNQRGWCGPALRPPSCLSGPGSGASVIAPLGVMRPSWVALVSVNQRAPSGPGTMNRGELSAVGSGNRVAAPLVVMRPIW